MKARSPLSNRSMAKGGYLSDSVGPSAFFKKFVSLRFESGRRVQNLCFSLKRQNCSWTSSPLKSSRAWIRLARMGRRDSLTDSPASLCANPELNSQCVG